MRGLSIDADEYDVFNQCIDTDVATNIRQRARRKPSRARLQPQVEVSVSSPEQKVGTAGATPFVNSAHHVSVNSRTQPILAVFVIVATDSRA